MTAGVMADVPGDPSRLAELRAMIDAIDESVHRLLIQRATVIDALIEVKGTARNGAAFRPGREADMMRRLAARHEGHLPLTAVEHLWREIISTFTALQAPFDVAVSTGADIVSAVETARFTFGFSVPLHALSRAPDVVAWIEEGGDRLGVILRDEVAGPWWQSLETGQIVARLPFFEAEERQAGAAAFVLAPPLADPVPFEISCYALKGPSPDVEARLAAGGLELLTAERGADATSALVAAPTAQGVPEARGLDIRAVGGYAAPLRIDGR